jgi:hypothetical protein
MFRTTGCMFRSADAHLAIPQLTIDPQKSQEKESPNSIEEAGTDWGKESMSTREHASGSNARGK